MKMPILLNADLLAQSLNEEQRQILAAITGRESRLRSSKPKNNGLAAYVWRMVAFQVSPNSQHHCIPMSAEFDLPAEFWPSRDIRITYSDFNDPNRVLTPYEIESERTRNLRKAKIEELTILIDKIVNTVPQSEWYGVKRWGNALGVL